MELSGERPVWSMSGGEMLSTLDQLDVLLARVQTQRLKVIAALETVGYAAEIGAHDTVQLLEFRYRLDRSEARRAVRLAKALPKYQAVSDGLPAMDGDETTEYLQPAQADAIVSALERVPDTVPVENIDVAERELVRLARHMSPGELRQAGQRARDLLDTDGPEPDEDKAYARESLSLSAAPNGVKFRGYLANENAELLRSLIHAGARPHKTLDGDPDPRPRDKRQADALTSALTIAATTLDTTTARPGTPANPLQPAATSAHQTHTDAATDTSGSSVPGFGAKANITVTIDLEDLKSVAAHAIGDSVYGDGLSAATIRRLACDARVIPLVLGSNSEPLDVGRSERLVTRAMRRALNARDRGCVVCGAPPIMCDAHHLISWINGGETKISNLALLCRRHHQDLHHGDWTITITNGEVHVSRPGWADRPRHADQLQNADPPGGGVRPDPSGPPSPTPSGSPPCAPAASGETPTPGGLPAALTAREAACLAIWGELPTPQTDRPTPGRITSSGARPFDPWAESPLAASSDPGP